MTNFPADIRFDFNSPVRLRFGRGILDRAGSLLPLAGRVLLVTGSSSAARSGLPDRLRSALNPRTVVLFDGVEQNPSIATVERGARAARKAGAGLVIGLGGGSAMDAAKVIAVLAANKGGFRRLIGKPRFPSPPIPSVMIPTTCGTGSEANRYAIITDPEIPDKVNFSNDSTYPLAGLLDPSVLDGIPGDILISTALDAFTHALEGFTSRRAQPFSDTLAVEAMSLIVDNLPAAARGGGNARDRLLYASALAGIVIDHTGTTMLHAMGYFLTLRHGVPHGRANSILMPALFAHLEKELPGKTESVYSLFPRGRRNLNGVVAFLRDLDIEPSLASCGVRPAELDSFAEYVLSKKNTAMTVGAPNRRAMLALLRRL